MKTSLLWFRSNLPFYPKKYISHLLILISIIVSIIGFVFPNIVSIFWLHRISLSTVAIPFLFWQILLFQFLHGWLLHLFLNSYFLYQAWPEIEARMKRKSYIQFFFWTTIFVAISLWILSPYSLTIGISGFCMALLSYLYMDLTRIRHPYANQILFMLIVNVLMWLYGNISFVWHASGALAGFIWWYLRNKH